MSKVRKLKIYVWLDDDDHMVIRCFPTRETPSDPHFVELILPEEGGLRQRWLDFFFINAKDSDFYYVERSFDDFFSAGQHALEDATELSEARIMSHLKDELEDFEGDESPFSRLAGKIVRQNIRETLVVCEAFWRAGRTYG